MKKRAKRSISFESTILEDRRLLALAAAWVGQSAVDYAGTEQFNPPRPNDFQDVKLRITGLSGEQVIKVETRLVGGGNSWWSNTGGNAVFIPDVGNPTAGDFYFEPLRSMSTSDAYDWVRVNYKKADGTTYEVQFPTVPAVGTVNAGLRMPGKELQVVFKGQEAANKVDLTTPGVNSGSDNIQDVRLSLSGLSAGADFNIKVHADFPGTPQNPDRVWAAGANLAGEWNMEVQGRSGWGSTFGTTADLYFASDVNLSGAILTAFVTYTHQNPAFTGTTDNPNAYTNRSGRTHSGSTTAGATNPALAMPATPVSNLHEMTAVNTTQDAAGKSHVLLNQAALPAGKTLAQIASAALSNLHGSSWSTASGSLTHVANATQSDFSFAPVRNEEGSNLTLVVTFTDGTKAFARMAGARSDVNLLEADPRAGASTAQNVTTVQNVVGGADLIAKLASTSPVYRRLHLKPGTYVFNAPLNIDKSVRITADAGITLSFDLSTDWTNHHGAIIVGDSHVALDGFAVRFLGSDVAWESNLETKAVIRSKDGDPNFDLSITNLDVAAPAGVAPADPGAVYSRLAIRVVFFKDGDSGVIANNIFRGGPVQMQKGPWSILDNDFQGAQAYTVSSAAIQSYGTWDLVIRGNKVHQVDPLGGLFRFFTFGNYDAGRWFNTLVEDNRVYGGVGVPAGLNQDKLPSGAHNAPEIMMFESYIPRFEGKPSAVSPDGYVLRVPNRRGHASGAGDVVSILTGPYAGQWRMIAQDLGNLTYLLDEPLPVGDFEISIGRGSVNTTIRNNVVDTTGMDAKSVGLVISGNAWGVRVLNNKFVSNLSLRLAAGPTQDIARSAIGDVAHPPRWGWALLPMFDVEVDGNTFDRSGGEMSVSHQNRASVGRTYFTAKVTNNSFIRNGGSGAGLDIGRPAYTQSSYPWVTTGALRVAMTNNWWADPSAGGSGTVSVTAAMVNGVGIPNVQSMALATASLVTGVLRGQDGRDFIGTGSGSTGPDGFQDIHIVLSGLAAGRTISQVEVTGYGGGIWRYGGTAGTDKAVLVRNGTTADLYIQPYQNETGRYITVMIYYTVGDPTPVVLYSLFATGKLPMPVDKADATGVITASSENPAANEGKAQAFDGNAATKWLAWASKAWIQYQFASGAGHVVTQYTITSGNDTASFPGRAPKSWTLKGSNDGLNWTTLDVRTGEANISNSTPRTYRFSNQTAYKYYRLDDIASNGDATIQIGEIELQTAKSLAIFAGSGSTLGWGGDSGFAGGGVAAAPSTQAIDVSGVVNPAPQAVYQAERYGNFTYTLTGLKAGGVYQVRLHFSENTYAGAGQRTFNVSINGASALSNFDIYSAAGGKFKAVVREFTATADSSGRILVSLAGVVGQAKIGGVEVLVPDVDLARGKASRSSADESSGFGPANAFDGDPATRWSSGQWMRNNQVAWLVVDLGAQYDIDRVKLDWEAAFGVNYQIQVSDDGLNWTTARDVSGATTGGTVEHANLKARGRYVRIYLTRSRINPTNNYSLYNVSVYGA